MRKKIYFIITAILQIIIALYTIFMANEIVQNQLDTIEQTYAEFSVDYQERMRTMIEKGGVPLTILTSGIVLLLNAIILKEAYNNNVLRKKGKLIAFSGICFFTTSNTLSSMLALTNIIILVFSKRKNPEDYSEGVKKEIPPAEYKESTKKELIFGMALVLAYFSQLLIGIIIPINTFIMSMIVQVTFNVIMLILAILCFKDKLKRDLKLFKENAKAYLQYILPKLGIMYAIYFIISIVCVLASGQGTSVNQEGLEILPKWFLAPTAIIWAPIVEELIFRGVLRRFIKNNKVFIIFSGIIFGLLHTIGEATLSNMIILAIPYAILGGGWAYIYAKTDNITNNILAHGLQNTVGVLLSLMIM